MTATAGLSDRSASRGRGLWIALALSLTLNLFVIGGLVWSMMAPPPPRAEGAAERLVIAAHSLDLNPDQRSALGTFAATARELTQGLRRANAPLMQAMWAEMEKTQPDQAAISDLADQALENRRAYQRKMATNLIGFLATLSPDQRKQFAEIASRRPGHREGGMARPSP
jgi:Spy/CpxP family protein refolding chaperone